MSTSRYDYEWGDYTWFSDRKSRCRRSTEAVLFNFFLSIGSTVFFSAMLKICVRPDARRRIVELIQELAEGSDHLADRIGFLLGPVWKISSVVENDGLCAGTKKRRKSGGLYVCDSSPVRNRDSGRILADAIADYCHV